MSKDYPYQLSNRESSFRKLNQLLISLKAMQQTPHPPQGWIKAIRTTLGMSMQQLGNRLGVTRQSILETEQREERGAITLQALKEAAYALDMQLVYGFVPKDDSLEALVERRAAELASRIVARTEDTMGITGSKAKEHKVQEAIREMSASLQQEMPKILWDTDWEELPAALSKKR